MKRKKSYLKFKKGDKKKGYTVKYNLSTREIPRALPEGFPKGSALSHNTDILNF